ncbi:MAG: NADP-dependent oxidoreductase [Myxococcaceae bacterium]|nr:MAG: NADP-dependent oxidoreductase [Myxococcaceae bacterium]
MTSSVDAGLAAVVHRFGPPEVIQIELVGTPPPGSGQVRLRVQAAGVGSWDAQVRSGKGPTALSLPLVLGGDLAGVVESVGPGVAAVGVGDVVFGVTNPQLTGACAELALADAARICVRPTMLTSIEAAAVPVVACTALQMVELAGISAGMRILVLGAGGNVGQWTTRLALRRDAEVVAVVQEPEVGGARLLGARRMLTALPARAPLFDVVLDTVGGLMAGSSLRLLRPGGRLVSSVQGIEPTSFGRHDVSASWLRVDVTSDRLRVLSGWIDGGGFPVPLGEVLPLRDAILAHRKVEGLEPKAPGLLVLRVSD